MELAEQQKAWDEVAAEREEPPAVVEAQPQEAPAAVEEQPVQAKPVAEQEPDPLSGLPDAVKEKLASLEKLAERVRNVEGHIGGLTSQQKLLKETMDAGKAAAKAVSEAPTQDQIKEAIKNPAEWDKLKDDFPEWATATEAFVDSRISAIKGGSGIKPEDVDARIKEAIAKAPQIQPEDMLDLAFQNPATGEVTWRDTIKSPEFGAWMEKQDESVKNLFFSDKVGDAAKMLRLYESQSDPAREIKQERQQRLSAAAGTPKGVTVPRAKSPDDMTPEELWTYEARNREKIREQRGY